MAWRLQAFPGSGCAFFWVRAVKCGSKWCGNDGRSLLYSQGPTWTPFKEQCNYVTLTGCHRAARTVSQSGLLAGRWPPGTGSPAWLQPKWET